MRRYMNVRYQLWSKWLDAATHPKPGPLILWDFSDRNDAADAMRINGGEDGWRTSSDSESIGGYSKCQFRFVATEHDYRRILNGDLEQSDTSNRLSKEEDSGYRLTIRRGGDKIEKEEIDQDDDHKQGGFVPFIRWWGTLDTRVGEKSRAIRSGYCAILSPHVPFEGHNLDNWFNHLELTVRADGRPYSVSMKISTYFEDDLYVYCIRPIGIHTDQAKNVETGGEFTKLFIPFKSFVLTAQGRVRETQRKLDAGVRIEHIGITLMDGQDGDFCFDLARIRAVNYDRFTKQLFGEDDEDQPY